jgi:GT2 family glycosyltransferase
MDERFAYLRSSTVGKSVALNIAIERARGPIIALTDDDCEVSPTWLSVLVDIFAHYPEVGQVCGQVLPAPHDATQGYIPTYTIARVACIRSPWLKWREGGIGANMAFRQAALQTAGPFDEVLGPGGALGHCNDGEMTYRVLRAGYGVITTPEALVLHRGFRAYVQGQRLVRETYLAISAAYMKHLRMGDLAIVPTLLYLWAFRCISWNRLLRLRKYSGLGRFAYYGLGLLVSFRYPIDRQRRVYLPRQKQTGGAAHPADPATPLSEVMEGVESTVHVSD